MIMKYINIFLVTMLITSCSVDRDKLVGTYVSENLNINCDTLILKMDGTYLRNLYVLKTKKIIYSHRGDWSYSDGYINLNNFLIDRDRIYDENYNFQEALMGFSAVPDIDFFGVVSFDYGPYLEGVF